MARAKEKRKQDYVKRMEVGGGGVSRETGKPEKSVQAGGQQVRSLSRKELLSPQDRFHQGLPREVGRALLVGHTLEVGGSPCRASLVLHGGALPVMGSHCPALNQGVAPPRFSV